MFKGEYQPEIHFAHPDKISSNGVVTGRGFDKLSPSTAEAITPNGHVPRQGTLFSHGTTPQRPPEDKKASTFDRIASKEASSVIEQKLRETKVFQSPHEVHTRRRSSMAKI